MIAHAHGDFLPGESFSYVFMPNWLDRRPKPPARKLCANPDCHAPLPDRRRSYCRECSDKRYLARQREQNNKRRHGFKTTQT